MPGRVAGMRLRCIRCGREVEALVEGRLCPQCYLEVYGLGEPPRRIDVTICPRCGAYRYRGEWYDPGDESLEDLVAEIFAAEFRPSPATKRYWVRGVELGRDNYQGVYATVTVEGELEGAPGTYTQEYIVPVRVVHQLCPRCLRKASGAPKAIVQVRSTAKRLTESDRERVDMVIRSLGRSIEDSIIGVDELREGIDIKLTDNEAARTLASKLKTMLGARITESYKVIGRESNGRPKTRLTLSARLPPFHEGSLVDYHGALARVERIAGGRVFIRPLGQDKTRRITVDEAWRSLREPQPQVIGEGIVVAIEPEWIHIQLLEDANYQYLELPLETTILEGPVHEGTTVKVYRYRGKEYIIGEEPQTK